MVAPTIKAQEELLLTDLDQPIRMADYEVNFSWDLLNFSKSHEN